MKLAGICRVRGVLSTDLTRFNECVLRVLQCFSDGLGLTVILILIEKYVRTFHLIKKMFQVSRF